MDDITKRILKVLASRNKITHMVPMLEPEEMAFAQYHIGTSLCGTFTEHMDKKDAIYLMEHLYESKPYTSRQIADEMFDGSRKTKTATSMIISKKYMPVLTKTPLIGVIKTPKYTMFKLNTAFGI